MELTFTLLWVAWILMFVVVESVALARDMPGDTLSEHIRKWFSVKTAFGRSMFLFFFGGFVVWFVFHIINPVEVPGPSQVVGFL